jgi:hypothetical protein
LAGVVAGLPAAPLSVTPAGLGPLNFNTTPAIDEPMLNEPKGPPVLFWRQAINTLAALVPSVVGRDWR